MLNNQTEMAHVRMKTFLKKKVGWLLYGEAGCSWPVRSRGRHYEAKRTLLLPFLHFDRGEIRSEPRGERGGWEFFFFL